MTKEELITELEEDVGKLSGKWHIAVLLLLGALGGSGTVEGVQALFFNQDDAQVMISQAVRPLTDAVDQLTGAVGSLDDNIQHQSELINYNQCQIQRLNDGGDINDCNLVPKF